MEIEVRPVAADQWEVVAWLWQAFRNDLSEVTTGLPRPTGRYSTRHLDPFLGPEPSTDGAGYLAWTTNEHGPAIAGFAVVAGLLDVRRSVAGFWVAPAARRGGTGRRLALDVIGRHPGPWAIAFQHDNVAAGHFWRRVADAAYGVGGWTEEERPVPGRPHVPPDHWIETR